MTTTTTIFYHDLMLSERDLTEAEVERFFLILMAALGGAGIQYRQLESNGGWVFAHNEADSDSFNRIVDRAIDGEFGAWYGPGLEKEFAKWLGFLPGEDEKV